MRRFTQGSGADRKVVVIELDGPRMSVAQIMPDGQTKRSRRELGSEAEARAASDQMAAQIVARGFIEQVDSETKAARRAARIQAANAGARPSESPSWLDDVEPPAAAAPVLARMATAPATATAAEPKPAKKKAGGKKKRKKGQDSDGLDMRVLVGIGAVAVLIVGGLGFFAYDAFLKPATIVGSWSGSMVEHEISKKLTHTRYDLVLDENLQASMTLQQKYTSTGTYSVAGDRLKLKLRDEDGEETQSEYKVVLGRVTLDLKDPHTGEMVVQLLRQREQPAIASKPAPSLAAPSGLGEADPAADASLASVDFAAKDSAFRLRYPKGWEHDTGSRPDNSYSWARFTKDSAKIEVYADVQGSLMSGSDVNRQPQSEGSETAPVHVAHELAKRSTAEGFSDYNEGKPAVFKGAKLGEGRIAQFTASGGLFGSRIRGLRVTLLTNDRRVTILCQCPDKEFAGNQPTFLAVCRSLAR